MIAILFDWHGVICNKPYLEWVQQQAPDSQTFMKLIDLANNVDAGTIDLAQFHVQVGRLTGKSPEEVKQGIASLVRIDESVMDIIRELRVKKRPGIGILSNVNAEFLAETLSAHHIAGFFDRIFASSTAKIVKPAPELFMIGLTGMNCASYPNQCAFVDDTLGHVMAAVDLQMRGFHFESAASLRVNFEMAEIL